VVLPHREFLTQDLDGHLSTSVLRCRQKATNYKSFLSAIKTGKIEIYKDA
jgi:hypothetical protein